MQDDASYPFFKQMGFDILQTSSITGPGQDEGAWKLLGDDLHILVLNMEPGQQVTTEPGTFLMGSADIKTEMTFDNCCCRFIGGEPCVNSILTNDGDNAGHVGVTSNMPAKILPIDVGKYGGIKAQKGAYMTSMGEATPSFEVCADGPINAVCAGMGCVKQTINGNGMAFLNATGTIMTKTLNDGDKLIIDTQSVVAYTKDATLGVSLTGGCCVCCFSGEGCCNTTVSGPGTVWIQSMPFEKMKSSLGSVVTKKKSGGGGEGAPSQMLRE